MSFFDYPTGSERVAPEEEQEQQFLSEGSEDDWSLLLAHAHRRRFQAGQTVMKPDDPERAFYLVMDGMLEAIQPLGRRGRPRVLATIAAGTVIGELSFFDGRGGSVLVRAVTDGELARLGVEDLDALARVRPDLARAVLFDLGRIVAQRLRDVESPARATRG
jgi:CRP-like cAMP-binding protein